MSVKFVSCFTSFKLIIDDNKILEKYLIDPSAAAMRVGRMDVKKRESHGLVPRDETRCKVMAYTFLRSYIFKTVLLLGRSQRLGLGVTFYVLSVTFYVLSDRWML